ncbi:MAG: DUF4215 domain-containing protein [Myxococcales bacterium]|nr:DUF4215 domain-containing protein [Myxococcales bacterium]
MTYCSMGADGGGDEASAETTASSTSTHEPCSTGSGSTTTPDGTTTGESGEVTSTGDGTTGGTTMHMPVCGDGVVEGEETCDDMNEVPDDGCKACARDSVIFISSQKYTGNVDGLAGADQRCRMLAAIAGLSRSNMFRAWLSTPEKAAADRLLKSRGRYVLVNGLVVAEDWEGLVSGALLHPIDVDEMSQTKDYRAWTGTLSNGQPAFGSEFCDNWTSGAIDKYGGNGISSMVDETWSYFEDGPCGLDLHLYCIEQ